MESVKAEALQASERPLRASGPDRQQPAVCLEALIRQPAKRMAGSREAKRPALLIAMLNAVHAGGEQGRSSDHLEPFSFCRHGSLGGRAAGRLPGSYLHFPALPALKIVWISEALKARL